MSFSKKHWLVHLVAAIVIVSLAPANCRHDKADDGSKNTEGEACELPHAVPDCPPIPSNNGEGKIDAGVDLDDEADDEDLPDSTECEVADDCGCGFQCVEGRCHKFDFSCCTDEDCKIGDFCNKNSNGQNGICLRSECDGDDDCDRCGTRCLNHTCVLTNCCGDSDCPEGEVCDTIRFRDEHNCVKPECVSNADCSCGMFCNEYWHECSPYDFSDQPTTNRKPCCDDDFYAMSRCWPPEYKENGRCLEDAHCPAGKICYDQAICLPLTCANNTDCGCEAVCRKGKCETGCDDTGGCCTEGHICDRGECIDPNEEDDEDEEDE